MVGTLTTVCCLLVSERTGFVAKIVMRTAGRETQDRYTIARSVPSARNGSLKQSCSMEWAGRQEELRPQVKYFFLTAFIELHESYPHCKKPIAGDALNFRRLSDFVVMFFALMNS